MDTEDFYVYPYSEDIDEFNLSIRKMIREYRNNFKDEDHELYSYLQFQLSSIGAFFKKRPDSNDILVSKWVSNIYSEAISIIGKNSIPKFNQFDKTYLRQIATLSPDVSIIKELPEILRENGIILIYKPAYKSLKVDGVAFSFSNQYFIIGISFRYPRLDHFWFTLLHELSHAYINANNHMPPKTINIENTLSSLDEIKANKLAMNSFIERHIWVNCSPKYERTIDSIISFAKKQRIHPAIVAGLLQREENNYKKYRELTDSVDTRKLVFENE